VRRYSVERGSTLVDPQSRAPAWIGAQVQSQARYLAYIDAFHRLMVISVAIVPLALILHRVALRGGASAGGHRTMQDGSHRAN